MAPSVNSAEFQSPSTLGQGRRSGVNAIKEDEGTQKYYAIGDATNPQANGLYFVSWQQINLFAINGMPGNQNPWYKSFNDEESARAFLRNYFSEDEALNCPITDSLTGRTSLTRPRSGAKRSPAGDCFQPPNNDGGGGRRGKWRRRTREWSDRRKRRVLGRACQLGPE